MIKTLLRKGRRALRFNLSAWLLLVSLLASVPMLCFSAVMLHRQVLERQAQGQQALGRRAAAAGTAVHQELKSVVLELRTLSQADIVRNGDLSTFHALARRVAVTDPRVAAFLLTDRDGRPLLRTDAPFGAPLPASPEGRATPLVFTRGETAVSPVFFDDPSGAGRIAVTVPMQVDDGPVYALTALLKSAAIAERLNDAPWPDGWVAAVLDQRHRIVARSHDAERFVGQLGSPTLIRAIDQGLSSFHSQSKEGIDVITSVADIAPYGWKVAVGRSSTAIDREVRSALASVLLGGVLCALLGIAFALFVAEVLKRRIRAVIGAVGDGGDMVHASSAVREIDQLALALTSSRRSQGRTIAELDAARRDAVTGLRGRALFMQDAAAVIESARLSSDEHRVALLYIDLDGFKQVNDRLGHEAGDRVLSEVAEVLLDSLRSSDVVGRIGGDEFAACLDAPADKIIGVSEQASARIIAAVNALGEGIGCSIGVAIGGDSDLDVLLDRADQRMLLIKKQRKSDPR